MEKLRIWVPIFGGGCALYSLASTTMQIQQPGLRLVLWAALAPLLLLSVSLTRELCVSRQRREMAAARDRYEAIINDLSDATLTIANLAEARGVSK
jgi:hypothetical protein